MTSPFQKDLKAHSSPCYMVSFASLWHRRDPAHLRYLFHSSSFQDDETEPSKMPLKTTEGYERSAGSRRDLRGLTVTWIAFCLPSLTNHLRSLVASVLERDQLC